MEPSISTSHLFIFQEQVPLFIDSLTFRESSQAKQVADIFKAIEKKYSKKISVLVINAQLLDE